MFRKVAVIGCGMTKFGRHVDETLVSILSEASLKAITDAKIGERNIDAVYVSTMMSGETVNQTALGSALTDDLALYPAAALRIENGPASGGSAFINACLGIASGVYDTVLVAGGEKMRHVSGATITDIISTMVHPTAEYTHGVTLPALAAMFTRLYMHRYGLKREHLAMVAVKNQANALLNPYAHIQQKITLEGILYDEAAEVNNPLVADPLRLYDCCPVTDGAAALIICAADKAKEFSDTPIIVAGLGHGTDTLAVHEREDPLVLKAVKVASQKAFSMANFTPKDISFAELHDAFEILEIAESEDAGFFEKGKAQKAVEEGITSIGGKFPINPSGGLKARGHPTGATGVAQIVELTWQLRGEAGKRQIIGAERAYCCNFGGFGNNVTACILKRSD